MMCCLSPRFMTPDRWVVYTTKYRAEESVGQACRYLPVVATEAWPNVAATKWMGCAGRFGHPSRRRVAV